MNDNVSVKVMGRVGCGMLGITRAGRFILALCLVTSAIELWAERVALVVGCGNYTGMPGRQLMSPTNDSEDVTRALKVMGYRLIGGGAMNNLGRDKSCCLNQKRHRREK